MADKNNINRRQFLRSAATAAAAFTIVPRHVLGGLGYKPPSEKLNVAGVGIGGMGRHNMAVVSGRKEKEVNGQKTVVFEGENIVALCDVDDGMAGPVFAEYPNARRYRDFRKMLEEQKDIDGVVIATPDHTHAAIAMTAMKMGKHVYVQKPLTHSVYEARALAEAARKYKVATQMGNQGHSGEGIRLICEWVWDGAIGAIREAHAWSNRPVWPQGVGRPTDTPRVPRTLDWDLWLGSAPQRPYHPAYHPFKWRGWWDFGTGALGDMGCHIIDPLFWALKLGQPESVEATYAAQIDPKDNWQKLKNTETYPAASVVHYNFPARGKLPPVKLHWYDGGLLPQTPELLEPGRKIRENGGMLVGPNAVIMYNDSGESPIIVPEVKRRQYKRPKKTIPRIHGSHEQNWIDACKAGKPACSNFEYAGPLTEAVLLGNIALRFAGTKLLWDGENMKFTNVPEANEYVHRQYRQGWSL